MYQCDCNGFSSVFGYTFINTFVSLVVCVFFNSNKQSHHHHHRHQKMKRMNSTMMGGMIISWEMKQIERDLKK